MRLDGWVPEARHMSRTVGPAFPVSGFVSTPTTVATLWKRYSAVSRKGKSKPELQTLSYSALAKTA